MITAASGLRTEPEYKDS